MWFAFPKPPTRPGLLVPVHYLEALKTAPPGGAQDVCRAAGGVSAPLHQASHLWVQQGSQWKRPLDPGDLDLEPSTYTVRTRGG